MPAGVGSYDSILYDSGLFLRFYPTCRRESVLTILSCMTAGCSYASTLYAGARTNKVRPDIRMSPASRKPFFVCTDGVAPPSTTLPGNRRYFFRAAFGGTAGQAPLTLFLIARFEKRHRNRFHSRDHFAARSPDTSPGVCLFVFLRNLRIP